MSIANENNLTTLKIPQLDAILNVMSQLNTKVDNLTIQLKEMQQIGLKRINRKGVADYLGLTWQQVEIISYRVDLGESANGIKILPCEKLGKSILYKMEDVEVWKRKVLKN